jgi:ribosomal protein L18E
LRKIGVSSVRDLEQIEKKNVDIEKVGSKKMNYKNLADVINKSKRGSMPPTVSKISLSLSENNPVLVVDGTNLHLDNKFPPVAVVNDRLAKILSSDANQLKIEIEPDVMNKGKNELVMTLDPYAIFKLEIKN